jgi:hypothetical protein
VCPLALKLGLGLRPTSMASATNLENQGFTPAPTDMPCGQLKSLIHDDDIFYSEPSERKKERSPFREAVACPCEPRIVRWSCGREEEGKGTQRKLELCGASRASANRDPLITGTCLLVPKIHCHSGCQGPDKRNGHHQ